ncbi:MULTISPECIES: dipeptide ABC transporter ATP-binding protein [unclassified Brevundimonas]|uniref:dipeptide ABC transporter ATP-binding protein n=1 Tax=unclassified Brevundimonas TaxID=2622653 RepID=UPI0025BB74E6|nr:MULTISPECIES: ABC transporter ATP-binding protein [unclassified Brevundimonas]
MSLLDIRNLSLTLDDRPLLLGINLSVAVGEIVALVGESGSGKSLTALSVLGLAPDHAQISGDILLDGQSLTALDDRALQNIRGRDIGMVFQEPLTALNPVMTIGDQVAEVVRIHTRCSRAEGRAAARKALNDAGLAAPRFTLDLYPHQLSGGQRQRVAIAMATAMKPRLLIADEATSALDPVNQAKVLDLLCQRARTDNSGLLLIVHDLAVARERADRVVVIRNGQIVENAPASVLGRGQLTSEYGQALLRDATHSPPPRILPAPEAPVVAQGLDVVRTYAGSRKLFGKGPEIRAVDGVSLSIQRGESVGLIGESGCGKSTLLRALAGLEPVQGGRVLINGLDWTDKCRQREMRQRIQPVFQDPGASLDPRWSVYRSLCEPLHLLDSPPQDPQRLATETLKQVGLDASFLNRLPHQMSGGQRQRVALARALMTKPDLIVLDEAVSALDVSVKARILDLLSMLTRDHNIALLFVSHDLEVVRRLTDRVLVMEAGRIVEQGPTETVLARPSHPATQRLVAATPQLIPITEPAL